MVINSTFINKHSKKHKNQKNPDPALILLYHSSHSSQMELKMLKLMLFENSLKMRNSKLYL
jgi:hypothetical protein